MCFWIFFLCMDEIREFNCIVDEEYWCIVIDDVVVFFFSIKFNSKFVWVVNGVS